MKRIITISREFGSGGRTIGKEVARRLDYNFFDRELVEEVAKRSGFSQDFIEENGEYANARSSLLFYWATAKQHSMENLSMHDQIYIVQTKVIEELAETGNCVIVGRCADYVLREQYSTFDVFVHSTDDFRCERICEHDNISKEEALNVIRQKDKARRRHYKYYTERNWGESLNYDLCVNTATCGIDEAAEIIAKLAGK